MILEIEGTDIRGLQIQDVSEKLRGPPSTDVRMVSLAKKRVVSLHGLCAEQSV
jgi:hypothetical protein